MAPTARPWWPPRSRSSCFTWPRSSTTTCSIVLRCGGARRRCSPRAAGRRPPRPATCCSRAPSPSSRPRATRRRSRRCRWPRRRSSRASSCSARTRERIGLAFQIFDDVLDVAGPTERTGKPRGTDLLDGTVTLPLILARGRDPSLRELDLRSSVREPRQAARLCDRIALTGALRDARDQALRHVAEANAVLGEVPLPAARRSALELVAEGVVERYA